MKLSSAEVELTLTQFEAQVIPDDHPLVPKLNELFGDHTFFLNGDGLNVVELNESTRVGVPMGTVVLTFPKQPMRLPRARRVVLDAVDACRPSPVSLAIAAMPTAACASKSRTMWNWARV